MKDYPPVLEKVRNFVTVAALALLVFNTLALAVITANPQTLDLLRTIIILSFLLAVIALVLAAVLYLLTRPKHTVIEGNVAFFDGRPVAGADVFVEGAPPRTDTDKNGNFRLEVDKREEWSIKATYVDASVNKKVTKAMVKRKEPLRIEFPPTTFKIKGNVEFSGGGPCQGALVYVLGEPPDTETNKIGFFELPVSDQSSWEIRATSADVVSPATTISRNNVKSPVRLILPPINYILSGSVHLADDSPVVGAKVIANGVSSDTNERGEFRLRVPERSSWQVIGTYKGQSVDVIVQRNEASQPIKLVFSPSVLIRGSVQFADGTPADGAEVKIETVKEVRPVDQEGFFEALANLKEGWKVTVRHSDYEVTEKITNGQHSDVIIKLPFLIKDIVRDIKCERFKQTGKRPDAIRGRIFGSARLVHDQEFWVFVYAGKIGGPYWLQGGRGGNFEEISRREVTESGEWLVEWGVNDIYLGEGVKDVRAVALKREDKAKVLEKGYLDCGTKKIESLYELPNKLTVLSDRFDPL